MDDAELQSDCSRCVGLCCVALSFSRADGFGHDKAAGEPCENLDEALDWAKKVPLPAGSIEVRPVMDYEAFGAEEPAAAEASS